MEFSPERKRKLDGKQLSKKQLDIQTKDKQTEKQKHHEKELMKRKLEEEEQKKEDAFYAKHKPIIDPNTGRYVKKYSEMSDDELISLCCPYDRARAKRVVNDLRTYLNQVKVSQGFDADAYPGWFTGLSSIYPYKPAPINPLFVTRTRIMCKWTLDEYNSKHVEKKTFEFVNVEKLNVAGSLYYNYYITFSARELVNDDTEPTTNTTDLKTFQAIVVVHRMPPKEGLISRVCLCRPKRVV